MTDRHCKALNKRGEPCRSTSLIGDHCFAHQPKEVRDKHGFGGSQPDAGRPKLPKPHELMRARIEAEIETILAPYFDAIRNATLFASHQGDVVMSEHPDLGARIAAAERLLDRVYGKPAQSVELSGANGGPIAVTVPRDAERARRVASILGKTGSVGHEGRQRREPSNGQPVNGDRNGGQ